MLQSLAYLPVFPSRCLTIFFTGILAVTNTSQTALVPGTLRWMAGTENGGTECKSKLRIGTLKYYYPYNARDFFLRPQCKAELENPVLGW
jgi:hypothetical protein